MATTKPLPSPFWPLPSPLLATTKHPLATTKPLPSPLWPPPSHYQAPYRHYQAPFGHYQATTKPPLAITKPLPSPFWQLPSRYQAPFGHYQAPFGHYQATTKAPLATTKPLPSLLSCSLLACFFEHHPQTPHLVLPKLSAVHRGTKKTPRALRKHHSSVFWCHRSPVSVTHTGADISPGWPPRRP